MVLPVIQSLVSVRAHQDGRESDVTNSVLTSGMARLVERYASVKMVRKPNYAKLPGHDLHCRRAV